MADIEESKIKKYIEHIRFRNVDSDPDKVYENLRSRISGEKVSQINRSPFWKYVAIAASVLLLITNSFFIFNGSKDENKNPVSYLEVAAIPGTKTRLVLPDSSIVWLNGSATIRYPQVFTGNERTVEFRGEGLFEVTENRDQPFIVNVEGMRIRVLGTLFNVWADVDSDYVETTLLDGSVALFLGKNHTSVADHILGVNQQAVFNRKSRLLEVKKVRAETYSSWVTHRFHFEDQTMEEIARLLERAFGVKIYIHSGTVRNVRLNARFTQQESLEEILSILQIPAHYTYQKEQGAFYIR